MYVGGINNINEKLEVHVCAKLIYLEGYIPIEKFTLFFDIIRETYSFDGNIKSIIKPMLHLL